MKAMEKFVESLDLEELSSREEFVAMAQGTETLDNHGDGLWVVGWKVM